ncbi:hypothetical protein EXS56_01790 [Candidatus Kaiserbacteria bacterium]|nr:hypothetical protein [Candidatus Kaiserbacteria bacterium]
MTQNGWIAVIVGVLIIGGGAWWFTSQKAPALSDDGTSAAADIAEDNGVQQAPMPVIGSTTTETVVSAPTSATITYNGSTFSPQEVTIKKGGTVTWKNTSGSNMWVASAQHPSHVVYSGTSRQEHCPDTSGTAFDQCVGGGDYSFTFTKTGTWGYHDHLNASLFGKVNVVE